MKTNSAARCGGRCFLSAASRKTSKEDSPGFGQKTIFIFVKTIHGFAMREERRYECSTDPLIEAFGQLQQSLYVLF